MYNTVVLSALCGASLLAVSAAMSHSLRGELRSGPHELSTKRNLGEHRTPLSEQVDVVVGEYYPSGWWMGEVTQAGTCDQDDYLGENQVVNFEGYALNVCILQGGNRMKYQCDGESIIQQIFSDFNCTHQTTSYYYEPVGCSNNVVYNCSQSDTIPVPKGESFVVQNYYAPSYDEANCTGQVQYFIAQENQHCFATAGGSQYNAYPELREYTGSNKCEGDFVTNNVVTTCTPDESNTADAISFTHFNTTLMVGKPVSHDTGGDSGGDNDDFFDDDGALIGVIVGGAVFLLLCAGAMYYFVFAKGSESLLSTAAARA